MDIQPLYGIPALKIENAFVIADMHIGMETHLMKKGYHLVSRTEEMFDCIMKNSGECDRLIVIGDVKDSVPGSSKQEYKEIPDFFSSLLQRFDNIDIVRGNHDTNLDEFLPKGVRLRPSSGMVFGDIGLIHGHTWPSEEVMECKTLIMAHEHPAVMFRDGVGKQTNEPCWLRGNFKSGCGRFDKTPKNFVIIPAFNRMLGGSPVNVNNGKFLSPLLNDDYFDLENAHIFLLDGIDIGKRSDNMVDDSYEARNLKRESKKLNGDCSHQN